jgi:hypothetical protein
MRISKTIKGKITCPRFTLRKTAVMLPITIIMNETAQVADVTATRWLR